MEKKSAEEFCLARIEEIKRECYSRLDSVDLSFSILNKDKRPRDYFADFPEDKDPVSPQAQTTLLIEEPPSLINEALMNASLPSQQIPDELPVGDGIIKKLLSEPDSQEAIPKKDFFPDFPEEPVKAVSKDEISHIANTHVTPASGKPEFRPSESLPVDSGNSRNDEPEQLPHIDSAAIAEQSQALPALAPPSKPKDYFSDIKPAPLSSLKKTVFSRVKIASVSEKPFSFYALLGLGTLILGGLVLGILKFYDSSWEYSLPLNSPVGLVSLQDQLLSLDSAEKLIYALKASSGKVLKKDQFVCDNASGFAAFQKEFWCSEADKEDVRRYFLVNGNEYELQRVYQTFGAKIGPIYSDGNYLWGADFASGEIFQYLIVQALTGTLLTPIDRFNIPGISPAGLYASNGILWILDAKTREIMRFKISISKADLIDSYDLKPQMKSVGTLAGLSVRDQRIWVLTRHPSKIFSFNLGDLPHHLNGAALPQNGANAR